jgi:hypothetical protein
MSSIAKTTENTIEPSLGLSYPGDYVHHCPGERDVIFEDNTTLALETFYSCISYLSIFKLHTHGSGHMNCARFKKKAFIKNCRVMTSIHFHSVCTLGKLELR